MTIHYAALKRGAKSILWSCSAESSMIDDEMLEVLLTHHMIAARESVTADALKKLGITNVIQTANIAFTLNPKKTNIPCKNMLWNQFQYICNMKNPKILTAYHKLIDHFISDTEINIMLVPHIEISVELILIC